MKNVNKDLTTNNKSLKEPKSVSLIPNNEFSGDITLPDTFTELILCKIQYTLNRFNDQCMQIFPLLNNCKIQTAVGKCLLCNEQFYLMIENVSLTIRDIFLSK